MAERIANRFAISMYRMWDQSQEEDDDEVPGDEDDEDENIMAAAPAGGWVTPSLTMAVMANDVARDCFIKGSKKSR